MRLRRLSRAAAAVGLATLIAAAATATAGNRGRSINDAYERAPRIDAAATT